MDFNEKDIDRIVDWLAAKGVQLQCPGCQSEDVVIESTLASVPVYQAFIPLGASGDIYPYVLLFCTNCGYTRFFNAITVGVVGVSPQEGQQ